MLRVSRGFEVLGKKDIYLMKMNVFWKTLKFVSVKLWWLKWTKEASLSLNIFGRTWWSMISVMQLNFGTKCTVSCYTIPMSLKPNDICRNSFFFQLNISKEVTLFLRKVYDFHHSFQWCRAHWDSWRGHYHYLSSTRIENVWDEKPG